MTTTATITARDLGRIMRAVAVHAHDDTAPHLNSVILTASGPHLIATATDRYCLAMLRVPVANGDDDQPAIDPDFEAWVPLRAMKQAATIFKGNSRNDPALTLDVDLDGKTLAFEAPALISGAGASLTTYLTPPKPELLGNLRRMLREAHEAPPAHSGAAGLNPHLIAKFEGAQTLGDPLVMWSRGERKPWAVAVGENFRGLIQGVRFAGESTNGAVDLDDEWRAVLSPADERQGAAA